MHRIVLSKPLGLASITTLKYLYICTCCRIVCCMICWTPLNQQILTLIDQVFIDFWNHFWLQLYWMDSDFAPISMWCWIFADFQVTYQCWLTEQLQTPGMCAHYMFAKNIMLIVDAVKRMSKYLFLSKPDFVQSTQVNINFLVVHFTRIVTEYVPPYNNVFTMIFLNTCDSRRMSSNLIHVQIPMRITVTVYMQPTASTLFQPLFHLLCAGWQRDHAALLETSQMWIRWLLCQELRWTERTRWGFTLYATLVRLQHAC